MKSRIQTVWPNGFPVFASIFQGKRLACRSLGHDPSPNCNKAILTDSKATINALYSVTTSYRLVGWRRDVLNSFCSTLKIVVLRVLGHLTIDENEGVTDWSGWALLVSTSRWV